MDRRNFLKSCIQGVEILAMAYEAPEVYGAILQRPIQNPLPESQEPVQENLSKSLLSILHQLVQNSNIPAQGQEKTSFKIVVGYDEEKVISKLYYPLDRIEKVIEGRLLYEFKLKSQMPLVLRFYTPSEVSLTPNSSSYGYLFTEATDLDGRVDRIYEGTTDKIDANLPSLSLGIMEYEQAQRKKFQQIFDKSAIIYINRLQNNLRR